MGVKSNRGGKYAGMGKGFHGSDKYLRMETVVKNGKLYYVLVKSSTGEKLKSAPMWRNAQSPLKWAEKYGYKVVSKTQA